jgi:hypothetical protein
MQLESKLESQDCLDPGKERLEPDAVGRKE